MEKTGLTKREIIAGITAVFMLLALAGAFGYFFGRFDEIQKNKARLEVIPDVNCGAVKPALH